VPRESDILPDDLRRRDQPETTPDSLPRRGDPGTLDTRPDGGVAQHPIHDEDQEDMEPDDFEDEIDDAADEFDDEELGPRSISSNDRDRGPQRH
jgi:hypothetical protein